MFMRGVGLKSCRNYRGLSVEEARKSRIIHEVIEKRLKQKHAARDLGISTRQVRRLVRKVKKGGEIGLIHGLVNQKSNHSFSEEKDQKILELWKNKYMQHDFNFTHFTNKLNEKENIKVSVEKVTQLLNKNGHVSIYSKKQRKHRKKRPRKLHFGEMIQQDTSPHDWLGIGVEYHLVVAIDDATSKILFMKLFDSDGTLANMEAFKAIMVKHGLPVSYYVDGASWFTVTRHGNGTINQVVNRKDYETQIERALKELGVDLIIAGSSQAKGRVERSNRTLQDRLISELKLEGIKTLEKANEYIQNVFIDDHNKRFAVEPMEPNSAFIRFVSKEALDYILCVKFYNRVKNDNTIRKSKYYELQLLPSEKRYSWARAKVEINIMIGGNIEVRHNDTRELIPYEIIEQKNIKEFKYAKQALK